MTPRTGATPVPLSMNRELRLIAEAVRSRRPQRQAVLVIHEGPWAQAGPQLLAGDQSPGRSSRAVARATVFLERQRMQTSEAPRPQVDLEGTNLTMRVCDPLPKVMPTRRSELGSRSFTAETPESECHVRTWFSTATIAP